MNETFRASLFGKFRIARSDQTPVWLESHKTQELLCFLLLHRDQNHPREVVASQLWGDIPTTHSKKHLRQALWQLQTAFEPHTASGDGSPVVLVESEWIQLNPTLSIWLDVSVFEHAYAELCTLSGAQLDSTHARMLREAANLYQDDLLCGWYPDWCLYKRERLQNMLLTILDRLIAYSEKRQDYAAGLEYGERILRIDPAHERTHRRIMRMLFKQGDRTAALRQYQRCEAVLAKELHVAPAERTRKVFERISIDRASLAKTTPDYAISMPSKDDKAQPSPPNVLERLRLLQAVLINVLQQVQRDIQAVEKLSDGEM